MISSRKRQIWYGVTSPLMWLNAKRYRWLAAPRQGLRVHLGPGQRKYFDGWLNVDANLLTARVDLWANILHPLPFRSESVREFYTWHVLEHLPYDSLASVLREINRCLEKEGVVRIGVPHCGNAAKAYAEGDEDWFCSKFPRLHASLGGKFANFILCAGEHLQILDFGYLSELLADAGFSNITECSPRCSNRFEQSVLDTEDEQDRFRHRPHTLVVETSK